MELPNVKESWRSRINEVTIGATKEQGGTRGKTITVGGQTTLPFMTFEGDIPMWRLPKVTLRLLPCHIYVIGAKCGPFGVEPGVQCHGALFERNGEDDCRVI